MCLHYLLFLSGSQKNNKDSAVWKMYCWWFLHMWLCLARLQNNSVLEFRNFLIQQLNPQPVTNTSKKCNPSCLFFFLIFDMVWKCRRDIICLWWINTDFTNNPVVKLCEYALFAKRLFMFSPNAPSVRLQFIYLIFKYSKWRPVFPTVHHFKNCICWFFWPHRGSGTAWNHWQTLTLWSQPIRGP